MRVGFIGIAKQISLKHCLCKNKSLPATVFICITDSHSPWLKDKDGGAVCLSVSEGPLSTDTMPV